MDHQELVTEMLQVERMSTQERLKHARKRRAQLMKRWHQYEKQLDKENNKKKKNQDKNQQKKVKKNTTRNVIFAPNIALLEAAARQDMTEGELFMFHFMREKKKKRKRIEMVKGFPCYACIGP